MNSKINITCDREKICVTVCFETMIVREHSYNKNQRDALFLKFFWYRTLHDLDRFTVHHQESSTVYTAISIYHTGFAGCLPAGLGWNILIPLALMDRETVRNM